MREIVLDTETTGLDPATGDRIVEIGCVELVNHIPSDNRYHVYVNPDRSMPKEAYRIHGLSDDFLKDKPRFAEVADAFMDFVGDARLIIHNAAFDIGFINAELARVEREALPMHRVVDTLDLARRKHPGAQNSLDALCSRYGIDTSRRELHGALLDAELLAMVYLELIGGRQAALGLQQSGGRRTSRRQRRIAERPEPLAPRLAADDVERHRAFIETLGDAPVWKRYLD